MTAGLLVIVACRIRLALFGATHTLYTPEQDDDVRAAAWQLRRTPSAVVILDGRTCSRAYQITHARQFATRVRQPLRLIECVCAESTAEKRLRAGTTHPAATRDIQLYRRLRASADPIPEPKLRLDTDQSLSWCAERTLSYLHS